MKGPDLEPLDAELDALLDAERARPPAAADVHRRVLSRVMTSIGPGGGGAPPGGSPPPAPPGIPPVAGGLLGKPILIGALLGGVVSAVLVTRPEAVMAPPAVVATVTPRSLSVPGSAPVVERAAPPPPAEHDHAGAAGGPPSSPSARASADEPGRDTSLSAERQMLDEALRALGEGKPLAALDLLDRHARTFPRGRLDQERETLTIRALARVGRLDEARARADRFRAAHPGSVMLPAIDAAVGTNP